jgi:diguanylate cyclase (GGDEF)-like protein
MVAQRPPLTSQANITSLCEDSSGRLWAGNDGGLAVMEADGRWRLLNGTPGFTNYSVFSIGQDSEGTVWVGTARGVFRFRPDGTVRPLMPEDGLAGYEANQNGFYCDPSGGVWIGTVYGLSRYRSADDRPNPIPPRIIVESADLRDRSLSYPRSLELGWRDRSVVFRVALLAFRGHHDCGYRARMEGFEAEWLPLTRDRLLRYTNLPPGRLSLVLQAVNESGVWGEAVRIPVRVHPPFWQTLWFRLGSVLLLAGCTVAAHRWRTLVLKQRNEELERTVAKRTEDLRRANQELEFVAGHDVLTGLPNRRAILNVLNRQAAPEGGSLRRFALLILDLDHFKKVNDTLGHATGDRVLCAMAAKVQAALREGDHLGRFGGDEFLVVLPGADQGAAEAAARRVSALSETVTDGTQSVTVTVSCGCVAVSGHGRADEASIVAHADELLYEVKRAGRRGYRSAVLGGEARRA